MSDPAVKARGAQVFILDSSWQKGEDFEHLGFYHQLPSLVPPWSVMVEISAMQLIAYHAGMIRAVDVDRPRNLAKSVTVE